MPMSSWAMMWQCMTKQPTETGLNQILKVIDPGGSLLIFGGAAEKIGGLWLCCGHDDGVVPFGHRQRSGR